MKNFTEDGPTDQAVVSTLPYKSDRYARILKIREEVGSIKVKDFLEDLKYKGKDIWDLKYISTSDSDDNNTDSDLSDEDEDDTANAEETKNGGSVKKQKNEQQRLIE